MPTSRPTLPHDSKLAEHLRKRLALRQEVGVSVDDEVTRMINRMRLESGGDREKRKRFKWPGDYKRPYERQGGICPRCENPMPFIRGQIELDHIDPNREDFNAKDNLRVTHAKCNASKGANTLIKESRVTGKTFLEMIQEKQRGQE